MSQCCPQQPPSVLWLLLLQGQNLPSSHLRGTSAAQHKRQDSAARWGACSSQHETVPSRLAEGLRGAMALSPKSFGRHGTFFFPPPCQPAGSNQSTHIGLESQIKSQAAASCREPTCHPSSHIATPGWHCGHSSQTSLQRQIPKAVCCHQRAPPAPSASTSATMPGALCCRALSRGSLARKGEPKGL